MQRLVYRLNTLFTVLMISTIGFMVNCHAQKDMEASVTNNEMSQQEIAEQIDITENLDYMINTWSSPVTREEAKQYTSMLDFWSDETKSKYKHDAFTEIWVVNLKDYPDWTLDVNEIDPEYKATGPTTEFTEEQLAIVTNAEYSDHLRFSARFNSTRIATGEVEEYVLVSQSMSLVPDVQATYEGGFDALISYLKKESKAQVKYVERNKVGRYRVFFTVTKMGTIEKVKFIETSNYSDVDEALLDIIKNLPKKWIPALNGKNEPVDQEFVFTFGVAGC